MSYRRVYFIGLLILCLIPSLSLIPEAKAQVFDHYQWYGTTTQGDTSVLVSHTYMNNETFDYIGHAGTMVEISTYFGAGVSGRWATKIGTPTGTTREYNIHWTDPTQRLQVAGRQNYTGYSVRVYENDTIGGYFTTGGGDVYLCQRITAGAVEINGENGDLTGIQTIDDSSPAGRSFTIQVLVGWNDPPGPTWGSQLYHGFGIVGVGMMVLSPILVMMNRSNLDSFIENLTYGLVTGVIGLGLFLTWIYYGA